MEGFDALEVLGGEVFGVGFEGCLVEAGAVVVLPEAVYYLAQLLQCEEGGGATAEIDRPFAAARLP
jgi:hypothetical protein